MHCPHCEFEFKAFAVNAEMVPDLAPIVCESCCEVSLIEGHSIRVMSPTELEAIKKSSAWAEFIEPALEILRANKEKRS